MGKATAKAAPITEVVVKYDLFDLPTAQHKAGLAGLLLQIRHMEKTKANHPQGGIPAVEHMDSTSATVRFTALSSQRLFDEVYAARRERTRVKSKWQGQAPLEVVEEEETDPDTKKAVKVKKFVYEVVQPSGRFLRDHLPEMDPGKDWLKLWREMLWAVPRSQPMSRIPFELRAAGEHCKEGKTVWADLLKVDQARTRNAFHTADVAGSLWLGAQAANAEAIPFVGRAEQNLLLHFWPLTVLIFVPQQIKADGESEFVGYVVAIPEVADLEAFVEEYPLMLTQLGTETRGYRPAEAVIDLPAQAALAFLEHLARLTAHKVERGKFRSPVSAVEYLHLVKVGNNVKSMAAGRVAPSIELVEGYEAIVSTPDRPAPYRNPLFRRGLLLALLNGQNWYQPMGPMLLELPWPFFVRSDQSPPRIPWFWMDAARMFQTESESHSRELEVYRSMRNQDPKAAGREPQTPLAVLINRLIRTYLRRRAEEKSGVELEKFEANGKIDWEKVPLAFNEAKQKLAESAFLEFRSRREQAFVDHFVATFCSVKQYLADEDYKEVAAALLDRERRDDVKTLTLLALSTNS